MLLLLSVALGEEAFFYISSYLKEKEKKRKSYVFLFKKKTKGKKEKEHKVEARDSLDTPIRKQKKQKTRKPPASYFVFSHSRNGRGQLFKMGNKKENVSLIAK